MVWSDPIPLERVKLAAHATGTTVNDVILTAVTGAMRADRERTGSVIHDVRVLVPFNLRPLDEPLPSGLGNRFGLVYLDLPLTLATPHERLEEMARRMQAIKHSAEEVVYLRHPRPGRSSAADRREGRGSRSSPPRAAP